KRKYLQWRVLDSQGPRPPDPRRARAYDAHDRGRMDEFYATHFADDEALARGLRDGTLSIDTRLRDALRSLGVEGSLVNREHSDPQPLNFADAAVDQGYVSEIGALGEQDTLVRTQHRLEALERRNERPERFSSRLRL